MKTIYQILFVLLLHTIIAPKVLCSNESINTHQESVAENRPLIHNPDEEYDEIMDAYILRTQRSESEQKNIIDAYQFGIHKGYLIGYQAGRRQEQSIVRQQLTNAIQKISEEHHQIIENRLTQVVNPTVAGIGIGMAIASLHCTIS